uniref:Uncharacterized protein n=1 Tax=Setaria viridis TaxID=4556 RepID=A0A4U6V649_SETVI|nr:hypothetical protein SEVIR_3G061066v2 [Setaria viridis]
MAANKNVVAPSAAALLVLLPLMMLVSTALAARHSPVGASHLALTPPYFQRRTPPPPPTASADDDASPLRKVPRGPDHSPNDPSPPLPSALVTAKLPLLIGEEVASEHTTGYSRDSIDGPKPTVEH